MQARRQKLGDLLEKRGYVADELRGETARQVLVATETGTLSFDVQHSSKDSVCYVYWSTKQQNMKQADFVKIYDEYKERLRQVDCMLIVTAVDPTQPIAKLLQNAWNDNKHSVNTITYEQLDASPWMHERWVPMKVLSDEEAEAVTKKWGDSERFPQIQFKDPAVTVYGARPGQVMEITRWSATTGVAPYYRLVIN